MKNKNIFQFLLVAYFLLHSILLEATVVIRTMTPSTLSESTTTYESFYDVDNNGQYDFLATIVEISAGYYQLSFIGQNGTQFETVSTDALMAYNFGTPIGVNTYSDTGLVKNLYFPVGVAKYVGFKFKIGGVYHCGYIKIKAHSYFSGIFILYELGYETDPTLCIIAGSIYSPIAEINVNSPITAFPNPVKDIFTIDLGEEHKNITTTLMDLKGNILHKSNFENKKELQLTLEQPTGVYFMLVEYDNQRDFVRVLIE